MNLILNELPDFIVSYLKHFNDIFRTEKQKEMIGKYLTGILSEINKKNIENIDNHSICSEYTKLRNSITSWKYDEDLLNTRRIELLQRQQQTRSRMKGVLIIDDSGERKSGEKTFGSRKQYLGCLGKVETGQVTVTSHYADSSKDYPLLLSLYVPEKWIEENPDVLDEKGNELTFKTKGELAHEQIKMIDENELINYIYLLFDGWYFQNSTFINRIKDTHKYICGCYRNQRVYFKRKDDVKRNEYTLGVVLGDLQRKDFKRLVLKTPSGENKVQYVAELELKFKGYGKHKVLVSKKNLFEDIKDAKILVSNDLSLSPKKMLETFFLRDKIEKFYQTAKEHLGVDEYQIRSELAIKRHWIMVYMAYSMVIFLMYTGGISYWAKEIPKTFGEALRILRHVFLALISKFITEHRDRFKDFLALRLSKNYLLQC